jgi:hypothetical protein
MRQRKKSVAPFARPHSVPVAADGTVAKIVEVQHTNWMALSPVDTKWNKTKLGTSQM